MTLRPAGALTDEEGRFRIVGVQPGEYTLAAERNGYLGGRFGASGGRPQARGKTIQLTAGDVKNHLTIELMPHAVLAGRVVDDLGEPVLGALVTAARRRGAAGRARWSGENSTTTNDRGEFRLHGLAAGTYVIAASGGRGLTLAQESGEVAYVTTYFPAVTEPSQAAPLMVNPGDETGSLEIRLRSSPVYRVRGRVAFSDAGQPPTRCMLILQTQPGSWSGPARPVANYQPDGRFEFRAVPPGSYVLVGQTTEGENRRSGVVPLEVTRGSIDDVALLLSPGVTITASVTLEGGNRALSSPARLSLAAADWTPWGAPGGRAGDDGVFRLERIMPGRYRPDLSAAWPEAYLARVLWNEQDVPLTQPLEVTGAPATLRLVYRLDGGALQGVVRAGDKPASAGSVLLLPVDEAKRQAPWVRLQPLREDGGFALQAIAPGDYYVLSAESIEAGDWDDPEWLRRALAKAQRVSVSARSDASLTLEQER
jgi:protocatechuate 3,4-dioxygenase beta subunit